MKKDSQPNAVSLKGIKVPHLREQRKKLPEWEKGVFACTFHVMMTSAQHRQISEAASKEKVTAPSFIRKVLWNYMQKVNDNEEVK